MKNKAAIAKQAEKYDSFYLYDESCIISGVNTLKENFPQIEFLYGASCIIVDGPAPPEGPKCCS